MSDSSVGLNFFRLAYLMYASLKKSKSALLSNKNPALLGLCHTHVSVRNPGTCGLNSALRWRLSKIVHRVEDEVLQSGTIERMSSIKQEKEHVRPS